VFGWAEYDQVAPPHSVIDVRSYKSPKELAAYLNHLADHPEEYNAYFQWKQTFEIEDGYVYKNVSHYFASDRHVNLKWTCFVGNKSIWGRQENW
jgi:hypothetical protein